MPLHRTKRRAGAKSGSEGLPIRPLRRGLVNALDKFKAFTPEHHIWRVSSKPREVSRMCLAPVLQRTVTFAFLISKRLIHFIETSLGQFNRLEDGFWNALAIGRTKEICEAIQNGVLASNDQFG